MCKAVWKVVEELGYGAWLLGVKLTVPRTEGKEDINS